MLASHRLDSAIDQAANEMFLQLLRSQGQARVRVRGYSMFPTLRHGDVILAEVQPLFRLRPGDIVLFYRGGTFCTHRLRELRGSELLTQGDANRQADFPVRAEECLGRVIAIERNGKPITLLKYHPALALLLPGLALFRRLLFARLVPRPKPAPSLSPNPTTLSN